MNTCVLVKCAGKTKPRDAINILEKKQEWFRFCAQKPEPSQESKRNTAVHLSLSGMTSDIPHDLHYWEIQTEWEAKPINLVYQIQVTGKY